MNAIHAIYEKGVFRATEPVDLPDHTEVVIQPQVSRRVAAPSVAQASIYEILSRRFETDIHDLAQRHDEHQP